MFDVLVLVDAKRQRTFGLWQRNRQACCCKPRLASAGVPAQKGTGVKFGNSSVKGGKWVGVGEALL